MDEQRLSCANCGVTRCPRCKLDLFIDGYLPDVLPYNMQLMCTHICYACSQEWGRVAERA